jgi:hypothetical protein
MGFDDERMHYRNLSSQTIHQNPHHCHRQMQDNAFNPPLLLTYHAIFILNIIQLLSFIYFCLAHTLNLYLFWLNENTGNVFLLLITVPAALSRLFSCSKLNKINNLAENEHAGMFFFANSMD